MPLKISGTSRSGLAVVGLEETEKESFAGTSGQSFRPIWKAFERHERRDILFVALFAYNETPRAFDTRAHELCKLLLAHNIRCVVTLDSASLKAVSPVHGDVRKLLGATIEGSYYYVIPLKLEHRFDRQYRAEMWSRAFQKLLKRGKALAEGKGKLFQWQPAALGESDHVRTALAAILAEKSPVGLDLETTGKNFQTDRITAIGIGARGQTVSVPWHAYTSRRYGPQPGLRCESIRALVEAICQDPQITKIFHNGAFDLKVLRAQGLEVHGPCEDTLLAHKIVYPDLWHNLQFAMSYEFALDPWKTRFEIARKTRGETTDDWEDIEPTALLEYNARDAGAEPFLWERLYTHLQRIPRGLENYQHLKELAEAAADMQYHGVRIDDTAVEAVTREALARVADIEARWHSMFPNTALSGDGSQKALELLFFETLEAPVVSRSLLTNKAQLSSQVLLEYAFTADNPLAQAAFTLFEHRKIKKTCDAFLTPLQGATRVHACPQVAGTRGTRFSYSKPNLQQWSKEKSIVWQGKSITLAPNLRHLIVPDEGCMLGEHDYNALEARIVAYAAHIPQWLEWLNDPREDMHCNNTKLMFKKKVTKKDPLRQIVKTLTFARFYNSRKSVGQVLKSLKPSMPDLTEERLLEIFDRFDKAIPQVPQWQARVDAQARKHGYVELPLSGLRQIHDPDWPDLNAALSFGIQSTAGDIINRAYLRILPQLNAERGERILINVHDALIWQAPPDTYRAVAAIIRREMESPVALWGHVNIVFPTECKVGRNWRDLAVYEKGAGEDPAPFNPTP